MNHTMILNTMTNVKVLSFGEDLGEVLGNAVYTVRVMLNIDPTNLNLEYAKPPVHNQPIVTENTVHVYPNPARETITVTFDQPLANEGTVEIWSIIGNKLQSNTIPKAYAEQKVNVSSLSSGIYFYIIKVNGDKFSSGKITIIK